MDFIVACGRVNSNLTNCAFMFFLYAIICFIDLGVFRFFKMVSSFIQDWTGVTSFMLARICLIAIGLCAMSLLCVTLFGQTSTENRLVFSLAAILGTMFCFVMFRIAGQTECRYSLDTENPLRFDLEWVVVRFMFIFISCMVSYFEANSIIPEHQKFAHDNVGNDILVAGLWLALASLYFIATKPDIPKPSRVKNAIRRIFPSHARV